MVIDYNNIIHAIHLFAAIKPVTMLWILPRSPDFDQSTVYESNATGKVGIMEAKAYLSNSSGHLISSLKAQLIEVAMKTWSSIIEDLAQFHRKPSKVVVESCLRYSTKPRRHCSGVNLDGRLGKIRRSPLDRALAIIVGSFLVTVRGR